MSGGRSIPLIRLNELIKSIGPDRHRFIDTFQVVDKNIPGSFKMLKGGEEAQRMTMGTSPNYYVLPIINSGSDIFDRIGGNLLVPDRIRINTTHIISMLSDKKLISNIFYALRLKHETSERLKALCFWMNTTWGIVKILANREETHGGFISMKMSQWRLLPVLNIDELSSNQVKALAKAFDKFVNVKLSRIPE